DARKAPMSDEFDLSKSLESARSETESAAKAYIAAQEAMIVADDELKAARQRLERLEKALAILNGTEEPATAPAAAHANVAREPAAAPPAPKPKPKPAGPYANVQCGGCQDVGTMYETMQPTKNGTFARLLV